MSGGERVYRTLPVRLGILTAFLGLLLFVHEADVLPGNLLGQTLQNSLHVPAYALLTLLLGVSFPQLGVWRLVSIGVAIGVAFEVLQAFTGRNADVLDATRDLVGALIAAFILRGPGGWSLRTALGGGLLLLITFTQPAWIWLAYQHRDAQFPELLDPGDARQQPLLYSNSKVTVLDGSVDATAAAARRKSLNLCFADVEYPGLHLNEVVPDWQAYRSLILDFQVPGQRSVVLTAAVGHRDQVGTSAFVYEEFEPGAHHWVIPLDRLAYTPNGVPATIANLILHSDRAFAGECVIVDRVRLE